MRAAQAAGWSPQGRRTAAVFAVVVLLVAVALYARTVSYGFAFDDVSEVVRNDAVRSLGNLARIFASGAWDGAGESNAIYRPLTSATYAVNYALGGLSPAGYHAVNVALHGVVCWLVLALALRLGLSLWPSAFAALVFAVHPVHVEVVANIAGRKDLLASGFVLASVLAHALARRRSGVGWAVAAPFAVAAALFSKESGVAALGLVAAGDLLFPARGPDSRQRTRVLYGAYAALFAGYLWARYAAVGSLGVPLDKIPYVENPAAHASTWVRLLTAVSVVGRGLVLMVWPHRLSPDYSFDAIPLVTSLADWGLAGALAGLGVLGAAGWHWRKSRPVVAYAVVWYVVALFPASNLLVPVGTILGERLLYLPSVGACLAGAEVLERLAARRFTRTRAGAAVGVLAVLGAQTLSYSAVWKDEVSLFRAAVETQGRSGKAHQLLAEALMEQGQAPEAVQEFEIAAAIFARSPEFPSGQLIELGVGYERLGRWEDAEHLYCRILERKPGEADALWRLGVVRWAQDRRYDAVSLWKQVLSVAPDHGRALSDLGLAAASSGDTAGAEVFWSRAVASDPRLAGPWLQLGNLYASRGELDRARSAWLRFLENARYGVFQRERESIAERLRKIETSLGTGDGR